MDLGEFSEVSTLESLGKRDLPGSPDLESKSTCLLIDFEPTGYTKRKDSLSSLDATPQKKILQLSLPNFPFHLRYLHHKRVNSKFKNTHIPCLPFNSFKDVN